MTILPKRARYLLIVVIAAVFGKELPGLDVRLPEVFSMVPFGTPYAPGAIWGSVPRTEATLESLSENVNYPTNGILIYRQNNALLNTVFSFPLGNMDAVLNTDGFVTMLSGTGARAQEPALSHITTATSYGIAGGSGIYRDGTVGLRLYDQKRNSWLNPFFFVSAVKDSDPPVIERVLLKEDLKDISKGRTFELQVRPGQKAGAQECPQGNYLVHAIAWDLLDRGRMTRVAPFRFVVRLDGTAVIDVSMMSATCTRDGVAFLGNGAPSSATIAGIDTWLLGKLTLTRGMHDIEVEIADYLGNKTRARSSITVY